MLRKLEEGKVVSGVFDGDAFFGCFGDPRSLTSFSVFLFFSSGALL